MNFKTLAPYMCLVRDLLPVCFILFPWWVAFCASQHDKHRECCRVVFRLRIFILRVCYEFIFRDKQVSRDYISIFLWKRRNLSILYGFFDRISCYKNDEYVYFLRQFIKSLFIGTVFEWLVLYYWYQTYKFKKKK